MTDVSIELQNGTGLDSFASDGPGSGGPFQMETAPVDRAEMVVRLQSALSRCQPRALLIADAAPSLSSLWAMKSRQVDRRQQQATWPTRTSGARARFRSIRKSCATSRPIGHSKARTACERSRRPCPSTTSISRSRSVASSGPSVARTR